MVNLTRATLSSTNTINCGRATIHFERPFCPVLPQIQQGGVCDNYSKH